MFYFKLQPITLCSIFLRMGNNGLGDWGFLWAECLVFSWFSMAELLYLSPSGEERMQAFLQYVLHRPILHGLLLEVTEYNPLYPDLSIQSLENIALDPSDMSEQVESYNDILFAAGLCTLSLSEGVFLYFALQVM